MPWMEILIVFGIVAEAAVLKGLLVVGGPPYLVASLIIGICAGSAAYHRRSADRRDGGWFDEILRGSAIAPPVLLAFAMLLRWIWPS